MKHLLCGLIIVLMWGSYGHTASPPLRWGCSTPKNWLITNVRVRLQPEGLPWCSITSSQMAYDAHHRKDPEYKQCALVTTVLQNGNSTYTPLESHQSCCPDRLTPETPFACQRFFWPEDVFRLSPPYRMNYVEVYPRNATDPPALPWEDVMDQLFCKNIPFIFVWKDSEGTPVHTAIAIGYEETSAGERFVKTHDPITGYMRLPYEEGFVYPPWATGGGHFEDYVDLFLK